VIEIAPTARVSDKADIEDSVRGTRIVIEDGVVVDAFVKIKPAGGAADVIIGAGSFVNSGTVIYSGNGVRIGRGVLIAANCTIAPVNHEYRARDRAIREQGFMPSKGGIVIEDDVWIGAGCVVLDGARLRRGTVYGACSVIRGDTEEYAVYAGAPIAKIGERK
jgi:acetyltransferase-like isoleucine patch superfamily enzyme